MKKASTYQKFGFVVLGCMIFACVAGYAYRLNATAKAKAANASSQVTTEAAKALDAKRSKQYAKYLVIDQWGLKVGLADAIKDATYHLDGNTVWLSTTSLDLDSSCYDQHNAKAQTFASIVRHGPDDTVTISTTPTDPGSSMSASQAVTANPFDFRTINGLVYQYKLDEDNEPCAAETHAQVNAFTDAWLSLRAIQ